MAKLDVKDLKGKKVGQVELADEFLAERPKDHVLHRTVVAELANARQGTQSAKSRSEVRGGGRKPYKQKKTGNARQGTVNAPHYAHGGMAFAVKPRDYEKKVNKKERRIAILGALAQKIESGTLTIADNIAFAAPKTKDALAMLKALDVHNAKRVLIILNQADEATYKCFRNLPNVVVRTAPSKDKESKTAVFSARDLLVAHAVVISKDALTQIQEVWVK